MQQMPEAEPSPIKQMQNLRPNQGGRGKNNGKA